MLEKNQPFSPTGSQREQPPHGTPSFPVEIFELSIPASTVPWHWHEDLEWMWEENRGRKNGGAEGFVRERKEAAVLSWC